MKKTLLILIALITVLVFVSCITTVSDFNKIRKGMSLIEVYNILGSPTSKGVNADGREYYVYNNVLIDSWSNVYGDFQIIFDSNGLVVQYGQMNSYTRQEPAFIYVTNTN